MDWNSGMMNGDILCIHTTECEGLRDGVGGSLCMRKQNKLCGKSFLPRIHDIHK